MAEIGKKCIKIYNRDVFFQLEGKFRSCCHQPYSSLRNFENIDSVLQSEKIAEIFSYMQEGKEHSDCSSCYDLEKNGVESARQLENKKYIQRHGAFPEELSDAPHKISIRFSNVCNFACRMCTTNFSTGRGKLDELIYSTNKGVRKMPEKSLKAFYDISLLKNIEMIDIKGGEPFLHKEHFEFLDFIIQSGIARNIRLLYASNLSILPGYKEHSSLIPEGYADIFELFSHFKSVTVLCSVEGYGEDNDYVRIGANWKVIEEHFFALREKGINAKFTSTVQIDNLLFLPKLIMFAISRNVLLDIKSYCFVSTPEYYDIRILPESIKDYVEKIYETFIKKYKLPNVYVHYLRNIVAYMKSGEYQPNLVSTYVKVTEITDREYDLDPKNTLYSVLRNISNHS